jgi:hypothetical protein
MELMLAFLSEGGHEATLGAGSCIVSEVERSALEWPLGRTENKPMAGRVCKLCMCEHLLTLCWGCPQAAGASAHLVSLPCHCAVQTVVCQGQVRLCVALLRTLCWSVDA